MNENPETIEVYHELVGRQIQDILQENRNLKSKVIKQENELKAIKLQYKSDIQDLKDEVSLLELINSEFKELIESITPKKSSNTKNTFNSKRTNLPVTPMTNKKRKLSDLYETDEESPLSQTIKHPTELVISQTCSDASQGMQLPSQSSASIERPAYTKKDEGTQQLMYNGKPFDRNDFTDSQFDLLPTQYSSQDHEDELNFSKKFNSQNQDQKSRIFIKEEEKGDFDMVIKEEEKENFDEIEDSQDEFPIDSLEFIRRSPIKVKREPLQDITSRSNSSLQSQSQPQIPSHYTKLQRRAYLKDYYELKFKNSPNFKIDLNNNPINETSWLINDFKINPKYVKPIQKNGNALSKSEQENRNKFYQLAGPLQKQSGIAWSNEVIESDDDSLELSESQIWDKFPSPPGFMVSEFPDTQEQTKRNHIIDKRQEDRIKRRIKQCILSAKNKNGEFVFQVDVLNKFVQQNRYIYG